MGDLHVENFGTWRDIEGRLIWGINDFDEVCWLPYTCDLVRLAASAYLAIAGDHLDITPRRATRSILEGYRDGLRCGGRVFVLAENHTALRLMAVERLKMPELFWQKLNGLPAYKGKLPSSAEKALRRLMPDRGLKYRVVHRVSGLGSLGRRRFVALADWHGGSIAREAKELTGLSLALGAGAPPAHGDSLPGGARPRAPLSRPLRQAARPLDRASSCAGLLAHRAVVAAHQARRGARLHAMGVETANVHLGTRDARALESDLRKRPASWLQSAAVAMVESVEQDWKRWQKRR